MKRVLMVILMCLIASMGVVLSACKPTESTHKHDYDMTTWEKDDTYHWHECKECGDKKDQAAHKFVDGKCEECGYEKKETEPHTHDYDMTTWKKDDTYHWHECKVCGDRKDQAEHNFVDGKCKDCGYDKDEKPTEHQHTYSEKWSSDATYHWRQATCEHRELEIDRGRHDYGDGDKCKVCGYAKPTEAHVHDAKLTPVEGRDATCTEPGIKAHYKCSCGELFEKEGGDPVDYEDLVIPAAHKPSKVDAKAATCIAGATREYYECSVCHKKFDSEKCDKELTDKDITISDPDASKHILNEVEAEASTCTKKGHKQHYKCELCSKTFEDSKGEKPIDDVTLDVDPQNHGDNLTFIDEEPASCTETGLAAHYYCSACQENFSDAQGHIKVEDNFLRLSALGHTFEDTLPVSDDATTHHRVCRRCGEAERGDDDSLVTSAHKMSDDGNICTECGYTENGKLPEKGVFTVGGIEYEYTTKDNANTASVKAVKEERTNYRIVEKVKFGGVEFTVTGIGANAFDKSKNITILGTVHIADTVTSIGDKAFNGQSSMRGIIIGDSVTQFGSQMFVGCSSSIFSIYYKGDVSKFNANEALKKAIGSLKVYYYAKTRPSENFQNFWYYSDEWQERPAVYAEIMEYVDHSNGIIYYCNSDDNTAEVIGFMDNVFTADCEISSSISVEGVNYTVTTIRDGAFYGTGLKKMVIPDTVTTIGSNAFYNCSDLTEITIGAKVNLIKTGAFTGVINLKKINFNGDIADWCKINFTFTEGAYNGGTNPIYNNGTGDCTELYVKGDLVDDLVIPSGVTKINPLAFFKYSHLKSITLGSDVKTIGHSSFYGCSGLTSLTVSDSVETIDTYSFFSCTSLTTVNFGNGVKTIGSNSFENCKMLSKVEIPASVTDLKGFAFSGCEGMKSADIKANIERIKEKTFFGCAALTTVTLPDSVKRIDDYAFNGCKELKTISLSSNIESLGEYVFDGCDNLSGNEKENLIYLGNSTSQYLIVYKIKNSPASAEYTIADEAKIIMNGVFEAKTTIKTVTLGKNITDIPYAVFRGCIGLETVKIKGGLNSIGSSAFSGCTSFTKIENGQQEISIGSIGEGAFKDCKAFTTLTIKGDVSSIDANAFNGSGLKTLKIEGNLTTIGANAFNSSLELTSVEVSGKIGSIGDGAFYLCKKLASLTVGGGVEKLGEGVFTNCEALDKVFFLDEQTSIAGDTFSFCSGMKEIYIPVSVTFIGRNAFMGCTRMEKVYYGGTSDQWKDITFEWGQDKFRFTENNLYYFSAQDPYKNNTNKEDEKYWHYGDNNKIEIWEEPKE